MREHGVFVPSGDRVLGAVVALPDREARGVVALTTGGGGALRSHHFAVWTRVARGLAERGIASIRMEHAGVGDSTGVARMDFKGLPVEDVKAVARFGLEATGSQRLGLCGNCGGARAALQAARSLPEAETLLLLWMKPLASTKRTATRGHRAAIAGRAAAPRSGEAVRAAPVLEDPVQEGSQRSDRHRAERSWPESPHLVDGNEQRPRGRRAPLRSGSAAIGDGSPDRAPWGGGDDPAGVPRSRESTRTGGSDRPLVR